DPEVQHPPAAAPAPAPPSAPAPAAPAPQQPPAAQPAAEQPGSATGTVNVTVAAAPSASGSVDEPPPREDDSDIAPAETPDARLLRVQNTWFGPSGGLHVVDAGSGAVGTLRLQ